jgi:hypothetical protein
MLLDVAGEDEGAGDQPGRAGGDVLANPGRDATALTVVEIDLSSLADPGMRAVTYRVVDRRLWVGERHTRLYAQLRALAETWRPARLVIDATGVGAGLASFLSSAFPGRVIPFTFNSATKSKLGWDFLAVVETGRFRDWREAPGEADPEQRIFDRQLEFCQATVRPGPDKHMQWGVPDGTRDPANGELLHDDLLLSAALCAALEGETWSAPGRPAIVQRPDPLAEIDSEAF